MLGAARIHICTHPAQAQQQSQKLSPVVPVHCADAVQLLDAEHRAQVGGYLLQCALLLVSDDKELNRLHTHTNSSNTCMRSASLMCAQPALRCLSLAPPQQASAALQHAVTILAPLLCQHPCSSQQSAQWPSPLSPSRPAAPLTCRM